MDNIELNDDYFLNKNIIKLLAEIDNFFNQSFLANKNGIESSIMQGQIELSERDSKVLRSYGTNDFNLDLLDMGIHARIIDSSVANIEILLTKRIRKEDENDWFFHIWSTYQPL